MSSSPSLPTLPKTESAPKTEPEILHTLHHFHLGDPSVERDTEEISSDHLPALLNPFRDTSKIRYDYPLVLFANGGESGKHYAQPLTSHLSESIETFSPGKNSARFLKDNISWIEREMRELIEEHNLTQNIEKKSLSNGSNNSTEPLATDILKQASTSLQQHLNLSPENRETLQESLDQLVNSFSQEDRILSYDRYTATKLMIHLVHQRSAERWGKFEKERDSLIRQLTQIIEVEKHKRGDALGTEALEKSVGSNASHFNPAAFSSILPNKSGTIVIPPERMERMDSALKILNQFKRSSIQLYFIHTGDYSVDENKTIKGEVAKDPCSRSADLFDQEAAKLSSLFSACRIAKLEVSNQYSATIHDPWFNNFGWEAFSEQELLLVPAIIALEPANRLAQEGLSSFSQLLGSGRPIQIMSRVKGHANPAATEKSSPFRDFRLELGYIAMAHRQCYVAQSSAARYQHLIQGFIEATEIPRTAIHLINTGVQEQSTIHEEDPHLISPNITKSKKQFLLDPWMVSSAALESRVHPFFRINPESGDTFAERMNFSVNPQPDRDWATHPFSYRDESGDVTHTELAFTFADYALLVPKLRSHFRLIPDNFESDSLSPVAEYLTHNETTRFSLIPFVWTMNRDNVMHRAVVSRELILACRDRLNYWHTLQEIAGVKSPHIEQAINDTTLTIEARKNSEISELKTVHTSELQELQNDATTKVMGQLAQVLMGMNPAAMQGDSTSSRNSSIPQSSSETESSSPAESEESATEDNSEQSETVAASEPAAEVSEDPWIETMLCTTCNDCTNMNPQMFVYNDDKQAYIADPNAGTYAELVEAAEICPSRCIHPGLPLNSSEADLDELIERAAPFNQI